jgi:DNA-binding beta-propeller fold protein YncE
VIDPRTDTVETTVNLTSFDEDPRPPFRFVTGGIAPTHVAMVQKPLYHGAISIHGAAPSPDNGLIATTGRGSSNVYLIDTRTKKVLGSRPNRFHLAMGGAYGSTSTNSRKLGLVTGIQTPA